MTSPLNVHGGAGFHLLTDGLALIKPHPSSFQCREHDSRLHKASKLRCPPSSPFWNAMQSFNCQRPHILEHSALQSKGVLTIANIPTLNSAFTLLVPLLPPLLHLFLSLSPNPQTIHPHVYRTPNHLDYESRQMFCFGFVSEVHSFKFFTCTSMLFTPRA